MEKIKVLGGKRVRVRVPDKLITTDEFIRQVKPVFQKIANRLTEDEWRKIERSTAA